MKHRTAICPACGAPVEFNTASSLVTICEFCETAVGRGDRDVEDLGKVAEVSEPASGLRHGMTGTWNKTSFTIVGRVRYRHAGGGAWDEWYLAFPGERWGWLAEAQGKFFLTQQRRLSHGTRLPDFDSIELGDPQTVKGVSLTVREKGVATAESAEGEIPWRFVPGKKHVFVDLYGEGHRVATFEYGDGEQDAEQAVFLGREVSLDELGVDLSSLDPNANKVRVDALQLNCPNCGGQLALRAPDDTLRVACPNCTSMLDAKDGKLSLFQSLHQKRVQPVIPLGSEGDFGGVVYTVIGFLERYAKYAGRTYPWTEYLLYNRESGYRWLVCNEGHWSLVGTVDSPPRGFGDTMQYDGDSFRIYDRGTAYTRYVLGEFYWKVQVGDRVSTADYIAPPRMLSYERSGWGETEEVTISIGHYIEPEELEAKFGVKDLRRPWGVGVIQPRPSPGMGFFATWLGFVGYLIAAYVLIGRGKADGWLWFYSVLGVSLIPGLVLAYLYNFEVQRWRDSDFSPYVSDD
ncbi:DUF4178 domain-containing protein [Roseiconus nitratireducens]|uniref:DUF4178 domain-containing protein n=1 Tax=Roseiconus nitratireducens TaxID=2605748 RepID=A0A5M6DET9_9BACT|nr:DUF4178 domain-containing protein [Roseiconus nitratireducens]KAA5545978.1 DUF4178 domain-containing protein [Roseiconus nitratireducens]